MAKFDISPVRDACTAGVWGCVLTMENAKASSEPAPRARRSSRDHTRLRAQDQELGTIDRGAHSQPPGPGPGRRTLARGLAATVALGIAAETFIGVAAAQPVVIPDPPPRRSAPTVGPAGFRDSADLEGTYLWLGPTAAAARGDGGWDSTVGGVAAVLVVREASALAVRGGALGASLWTERAGGRLWLDAVVGTRLGGGGRPGRGVLVGVSAGPLVEFAPTEHPRIGGSVGLWGFVGITPYARIGAASELGAFVEIGVHLMLPVMRH